MPPKLSLKRKLESKPVTEASEQNSAKKIPDKSPKVAAKTYPRLKLTLAPYRGKSKGATVNEKDSYQWQPFPPSKLLPEIYLRDGR